MIKCNNGSIYIFLLQCSSISHIGLSVKGLTSLRLPPEGSSSDIIVNAIHRTAEDEGNAMT